MKLYKEAVLFLKGLLMGISDIIPGISGGTIALITGIYAQLIHSIKDLTHIPSLLAKKEFKKSIDLINFKFFTPLVIGIALAILIGSHIIGYFLDNYSGMVYGFFIGLILVSAHSIMSKLKLNTKNFFFSTIGVLIGLSLGFLAFNLPEPSLMGVFLIGFISISAMILPGISGAYILLILGQYEFIINVVRNFYNEMLNVLSFALGAIIGLAVLSRIISYYYKKHKNNVLSLLVGLKLGALIVPFRELSNADTLIGHLLILIIILSYAIYKIIK